jgi:phosphate transport system substrate-binding protein
LADIFLGKIKNWNDPAISSMNRGVALPNQEITVVHRSDGSGTSYIWADYLSKVSDEWKNKVGKGTSVKWPVGVGANGNEGVSERIREVKGAIGYVELSYAQNKKIPFGSVQNPNGLFSTASVGGIKEAAASAVGTQSDLRVSISNAPGPNAYPVASFSWILVPVRARNPESKKALNEFLVWILTDGQKYAADLYYSPLPPEVAAKAQRMIEESR